MIWRIIFGQEKSQISKSIAASEVIAGAVLGISISTGICRMLKLHIPQFKALFFDLYENKPKLRLHEEKLDILKKWIQTGDVNVRKEVLKEEKNIIVPVKREELVIKKGVLDGKAVSEGKEEMETIRIPICEERIEVIKHPTLLEDVSIYKYRYQNMEKIEETLKKEKEHIESTGDVEIIKEETPKSNNGLKKEVLKEKHKKHQIT